MSRSAVRLSFTGGPVGARLRGPLGFVVLLLCLRALFLYAALDPSQERVGEVVEYAPAGWTGGPDRPLYDREELYTATAAEAIRMRLPVPLDTYRYMPYGSGSLLLSLALVPLYALTGPTYPALKLAGLSIAVLGGLCWFLFAWQWLGRRGAWTFGLLYLLAPTVLTRTALIAKGDHAESMALAGGIALLAIHAVRAETGLKRMRWSAACGLLTGLLFSVSYTAVPALAGAGLAALIATRGRPWRVWAAFAAGLLIGLIPWLAFVMRTSGAAVQIYGEMPGVGIGVSEWLNRAQLLINQGLFASFDLPGRFARGFAGLLWLVAVLVGGFALVRSRRSPLALAVLAGITAHFAAFCLLAPEASPRYLLPAYPLLLLSIAFASLPRVTPLGTGRASRAGMPAVAVVLLLGFVSQANAVRDSRFAGLHPPLAGTDWPLFGEIAGLKLRPAEVALCPEPVRRHVAVGLGRRAYVLTEQAAWPAAALSAGPRNTSSVWEGIGMALMEDWRMLDAAAILPALAPESRAGMLRGITRYAEIFMVATLARSHLSVMEALLAEFAPEERAALRPPLARCLAVLATHGIQALGEQDPSQKSSLPAAGALPPAPVDLVSPAAVDRLRRLTGPDELLRGAGYALYRNTRPGTGIRFWNPPRESWVAPLAAQVRAGAGPPALWQGVAYAFEQDLAIRSPRWLAGRGAGDRLGAFLAHVTRGLPESIASLFFEAAGRAVARAAEDPAFAGADRRAELMREIRMSSAMPPARHDAFLAAMGDPAATAH